ncbi:uncharacterized protein LOC131647020 [Vicia villosa]|uniref:uncharacterized protein LOC131647020 n=1 Tax=Vicia villosa TaxID=3911 RepID=UPI00273C8B80|nr:uncharacterized protein LOC131647020 [Vicia villosa]
MCGDEYCVNECSSHYLSTSVHDKCARCGSRYDRPVFPKSFVKGFVNNVATFVITDGLFIMPNSMVYPSFSLLQNSGIDTCSAKELTLNVNEEKVLDLLKCALVSQSPLTDVFLREKPSIERYWCSSRGFGNSDHIKITLQLVISKSKRKILFAHGEQDFVDLLLSFLTFPLGGVVRKLGGYSSIANIDRMYASIVELDENKYLMSKEAKMRLVDPHVVSKFKSNKKILPTVEPRQYLYCHYRGESYKKSIINGQFFITNEYRSDDRKCVEMPLVKSQKCCAIEEGYVKGPRTYLITDDLVIGPSSPISALLLTNRLQIPLDDLKEKVVMIGLKECLNILKAALTTTSALTNGLSHLLTVTEKN